MSQPRFGDSTMKILVTTIATLVPTVVVQLAGQPVGSAYPNGGTSKHAPILCQGRGKHPTWKVVNSLRIAVHEKARMARTLIADAREE